MTIIDVHCCCDVFVVVCELFGSIWSDLDELLLYDNIILKTCTWLNIPKAENNYRLHLSGISISSTVMRKSLPNFHYPYIGQFPLSLYWAISLFLCCFLSSEYDIEVWKNPPVRLSPFLVCVTHQTKHKTAAWWQNWPREGKIFTSIINKSAARENYTPFSKHVKIESKARVLTCLMALQVSFSFYCEIGFCFSWNLLSVASFFPSATRGFPEIAQGYLDLP